MRNTIRIKVKDELWERINMLDVKEVYLELNDYYITQLLDKVQDFRIKNELFNDPHPMELPIRIHKITIRRSYHGGDENLLKHGIFRMSIGYGKEKWGADPNKLYFVVTLGKSIIS